MTPPCNAATTGTLPNWIFSNARCHRLECAIPCAMSRSSSSDRSRPAEKCSPSPARSTAWALLGNDVKNCSMPTMVSSSSALRFCGRLSFSTATLPCRSAASEAGSCAAKLFDDIPRLILSVARQSCRCGSACAISVLDQGTAAFVQRPKRLLGRDCPHDFEDIPFAFRFGRRLYLQQIHRMDLAAVGADTAFAKQRVFGRNRLHGGDNRSAVSR